jgi:hypothetical protein
MILLLREAATPDQIAQMLADWEVFVKVVVDTRRAILTLLLADGSRQEDLWGANWYPASREIHFEALINIRPRHGNRRMQGKRRHSQQDGRDHPWHSRRSNMKDFASVKARYLRDPIPVRLGGLAADLARIGSTSSNPLNRRVVQVLLEQARRFIEWTAAELEVEAAGELMDLQLALTLWLYAWEHAYADPVQRALLAHEATCWSDQVLALSGLTTQSAP